MFSVIFEVQPRPELRDAYFARGRSLRPELEQIDGFVDNIRYGSLTRPGWVLSLSGWRDEKALVRWRTHVRHHETQSFGRSQIFLDYHLRVGGWLATRAFRPASSYPSSDSTRRPQALAQRSLW